MQQALTAKDYNRRCSPAVFEYLRCGHCGAYELERIPQDLGAYYPSNYYVLPANLHEADLSLAGDQYKLDMIRQHVQGGRLLEIGPGAGMFAHLASKNGFSVETIEMNKRSARFIQEVLGIRTHYTDDEISTLAKCEDFDVIAMWHVIEHVRDPVGLLDAAEKKLAKGGILVVATPNPDALQFRVLRGRWAHLDAPRHIFLIPAGAIRAQAERLALDEVLFTTTDKGALYWNRFGWEISLRSFFSASRAARFAGLAAGILTELLRPLEAMPGLGSAYTMILRKA